MHIIKNQDKFSWQPNTCMLSEEHPLYACESEEEHESLMQVGNSTSVKKERPKPTKE